jgi:hypothetical protein
LHGGPQLRGGPVFGSPRCSRAAHEKMKILSMPPMREVPSRANEVAMWQWPSD